MTHCFNGSTILSGGAVTRVPLKLALSSNEIIVTLTFINQIVRTKHGVGIYWKLVRTSRYESGSRWDLVSALIVQGTRDALYISSNWCEGDIAQ